MSKEKIRKGKEGTNGLEDAKDELRPELKKLKKLAASRVRTPLFQETLERQIITTVDVFVKWAREAPHILSNNMPVFNQRPLDQMIGQVIVETKKLYQADRISAATAAHVLAELHDLEIPDLPSREEMRQWSRTDAVEAVPSKVLFPVVDNIASALEKHLPQTAPPRPILVGLIGGDAYRQKVERNRNLASAVASRNIELFLQSGDHYLEQLLKELREYAKSFDQRDRVPMVKDVVRRALQERDSLRKTELPRRLKDGEMLLNEVLLREATLGSEVHYKTLINLARQAYVVMVAENQEKREKNEKNEKKQAEAAIRLSIEQFLAGNDDFIQEVRESLPIFGIRIGNSNLESARLTSHIVEAMLAETKRRIEKSRRTGQAIEVKIESNEVVPYVRDLIRQEAAERADKFKDEQRRGHMPPPPESLPPRRRF